MSYSEWPFFFAHTFPQTAGRMAGRPHGQNDAAPAGPEDDTFAGWSADRACQRLDESLKDPRFKEWREAYHDRRNALHEHAVREFGQLHEIAYPEKPAEVAQNAGNQGKPTARTAGMAVPVGTVPSRVIGPGGIDRAAALRRIDALYADKEFMERCAKSGWRNPRGRRRDDQRVSGGLPG